MDKKASQYWYVHGQAYDLSKYVDWHPGGKEQMMDLRGRDCTEMVYSMHALASVEKVHKILAKYKVEIPKSEEPEIFVWSEDHVYGTLKKRVNEYFTTLGGGDAHKSNTLFWVITACEAAIQVLLFYWWICGGSYISPLIAGIVTTSIGFMLFHTAGHNGISKNPKVNTFWYNLYANYILCFTAKLWNIHHNYGHHSYTNIHRKDPDVSNALAFIRKSPHQTLKPQHERQWYVAYLLLVFMPNQWFGQVVQYFLSTMRGKIFGMPLIQKEERAKSQFLGFAILAAIVVTSVYLFQGLLFALITTYLYSFGVGFMYWACVFPNHDTDDTEQASMEEVIKNGADWGEHQIRSSSDFWLPDWLGYFIGGMNYQIEHHLFPTVHPRHYPAIAKMVQDECKKRNIPYTNYPSWFHALYSNFKHLRRMSRPDKTA